jgi:glycosyltransferase involved in cell wall biosynthesis
VKGHELLLDAFGLLVARGTRAHLVLAGERTDGPEAKVAVQKRGLVSRVQLLGSVSQRELATVLRSAELATITSWHEAECLAVVEALACGLPVVSTRVGIAPELLVEPMLGHCLSTRSPVALANALQAQLESNNLHAPGAVQARCGAVAHLEVQRVAERFLGRYRALAELST